MNSNLFALPPIEAGQPCYKCHRTGPLVVDRFAQRPDCWDNPERFMHQYGLCPELPVTSVVSAADLPLGSIVGLSRGVYVKGLTSGEADGGPAWVGVNNLGDHSEVTDAKVDELLLSGEAAVLRVGSGA